MKKVLLIMSAFLLMGGAVSAQNGYWSYGIKGGFNWTNLSDDLDVDTKVSIHIGAFAEYRVNDFFGIQPEFVYSRQGTYEEITNFYYGKDEAWFRINYFNIPVLAKLYVTKNLSINLGPQFGILLNSKLKMKEDGVTYTESVSGGKGLEFSFAMGASYNLGYHWIIDVRYNLGLTDVNKYVDAKNRVVQLGAGYRF